MIIDLRFIERDGKRILQKASTTWKHIQNNDGSWSNMPEKIWEDVSLYKEPERADLDAMDIILNSEV